MGKIKQFWHTKKSICIIIAMLLVSLLAIGGLLLLEKEDKPVENKVETGKKDDKKDEGIKVISHLTIGGWLDDRAESKELGPHRSYDGNTSTKWNPQASGNYKGEAGIIYLLNGYYDLEEISLTFGSREYFFDLYVSTDGEEYAQVCSVTSANMSDYFSEGYIFSVGELKTKKVAFVKVVFTGSNSSDNNTYVNFMEISFEGEYQGKGPTQIPDPNGLGIELATISSATLVGEWKEDRSGSKEYNVARSYDNNLYSKWNPQAYGSYKGDPGVVYKLDKPYNLKQIILSFEGSEHYFDLYLSATGSEYTQIASVHQENASMGYSGTVCRLDGLKLEKIRYVKIIFTGRQGNSTWVNLSEIQMSEEGTDNADTSWMLMSKSTDRYEVEIQKAVAIGSWAKDNVNHVNNGLANSYDKNETSKWNPQANSGYKGEPGVVFTLSKAYDIRLMRFTFSGTTHYFDVYVSSNGQTYEQVANITYVNANKGYKDMVCTLDGLKLNDVKYVKVIFSGRDGNSTWVNFMELGLSEKGLGATDASWMMQGEAMTDYEIKIASAQAIGSWAKDNVNHASNGLTNAYDKNPNTKWNPLANKNYSGDPGVIFALDKEYSIQKMEFTFGSSIHYFNVYVSSDGNTYEKIAAINVLNEKNGYTGTVCTLDGLKASNVKYIKVIFTGRSGNSCWVNFMELGLSQTGSSTADTSWMLPAQVEESNVTIVNATTSGTWLKDNVNHATNPLVNSYDGNVNTKWNPQAKPSYKDAPDVIYTLDKYYDLDDITITFGSREYFFDIYTSVDGSTYTKLLEVTKTNMSDVYEGYICTVDASSVNAAKYVKIVFTGSNSADNNTYVNLFEIGVTGTEAENVPDMPSEPEEASLKVSGVFSSNMVLQRNKPISVWGWADKGNTITGVFADTTQTVVADADGAWKLTFPAQQVNTIPQSMTISCGSSTVEFDNILIGDVYLVSGQSNAELSVSRTAAHLDNNGKEEVKDLFRSDNKVRIFLQTKSYVVDNEALWSTPQKDVINPDWCWQVASEEDAFWNFSALGCYFAKSLRESLNEDVPIGMVQMAAGGAFLEELMPNELNEKFGYTDKHAVTTGGYYNTMIHPFVGLPVSGMLFYQGESNSTFKYEDIYARDLSAYITELRERWNSEFNVYNVQLSYYGTQITEQRIWQALPQIRNQQYQVLDMLQGYYLTVSMDVGYNGETDTTGLQDFAHPKDKKTLGERIAKQALAVYYDELTNEESAFSPVPSEVSWNADSIIITFDNAGTSLGLAANTGDTLKGFQCVINEETTDVPAEIINGNQVKISVDTTMVSVVQYAMFYESYLENANLCNEYGLPTPAFEIPNPGEYTTTKIVIKGFETTDTGWTSLGASGYTGHYSYDNDTLTKWNPQVANYSAEPGITYNLNKAADISKLQLTFGSRKYYFTLYASTDGSTYTEIAKVTADNGDQYYTDYVCSIPLSGVSNVTNIRLVFDGSSDNSKWVNLFEVTLDATVSSTSQSPEIVTAVVSEHEVTGTWLSDKSNSASVGPVKSYDGDATTKWNPQAQTSYAGTPGIIYTLDKTYDLSTINLTFGSRKYHFDVYVSGDGTTYTKVDSITADNKADRFSADYVCAINLTENASADSVKYIKLIFTGADTGSTYVNLMEIGVTGFVVTAKVPEIVNAAISAHQISGTWTIDRANSTSLGPVNSYDGNAGTKWNPQAQTNYEGLPGIVFTLDRFYYLRNIMLTFTSRQYYFDIYTSADGTEYTLLKSVTASNAAEVYTDFVCDLETTSNDKVKYLKIVFSGSNSTDNNAYVNLNEVNVKGMEVKE